MSRFLRRLLRHRTTAGTRASAVGGAAVLVIVAAGTALAARGPGSAAPGQATVTGGGLASATLRVLSGTSLLSVRVGNLGGRDGTLIRVATPAGDPVRPQLQKTGSGNATVVRLSLAPGTASGSAASPAAPVTVTLNAAVTWGLLFAGGTQRTVVDLRGGRVTALAFTAGSSVVDVTLPRPHGTVPLLLTGGASRLLIRLPAGVPARVTAGGGAGEVTLDRTTQTGVAGGTMLTSPSWPTAGPRVDVDAVSGAALISVTRWGG